MNQNFKIENVKFQWELENQNVKSQNKTKNLVNQQSGLQNFKINIWRNFEIQHWEQNQLLFIIYKQ